MKKIRPFQPLAITAAILILMYFFSNAGTMDVHLHDTYFVFSSNFIFAALAIVLIFFSLFYWLAEKILLSRWLSWIHVIACILFSAVFCYYLLFFSSFTETSPRRYADFSNWESMQMFNDGLNNIVRILATLLLFQVIFPVNIIFGAIKSVIRKNKLRTLYF